MRILAKTLLAALLLPAACQKKETQNETIRLVPDARVVPGIDGPTPDGPQLQGPFTTVSWNYEEKPGNVLSPGRGFYSWNAADTDKTLVLLRIVLTQYCGADQLDEPVLNAVATRLADLRKIPGKLAIVRVIYADNGSLNPCGLAEAARPDIPIQHLKQLAPILKAHRQDIAYFEAGFFGMWGEWNSEYAPNGRGYAEDPQLRFNMVRALLDHLPHDLLIMIRRPRFRAELASQLSAAESQRLAFHNDCYLASGTDMGTYDGELTPDQWRDYIGKLAREGQAIGGETCVDDPIYTNCESALKDMQKLGMTYLNTGWNTHVLERWKKEGCFEEVESRLGYRFVLKTATVTSTSDKKIKLDFTVRNDGFAPAYPLFQPQIFLEAGDGVRHELKIGENQGADPRAWLPGQTTQGSLYADAGHVPSGVYKLHLRWTFYDRVLRFAIYDIWQDQSQSYVLGTVKL